MTSSDEFITQSADELTAEDFANYQKWQAPRMVSVSDVEDGINPFLTVEEIELMQKQAQEEGHKIGFEEGKQSGYQAGLEQGQAEINQRIAYLQNIISSLNHPLNELDEVIENDLLQLVKTMATQVIGRELVTKPELIVSTLKSAMSELPVNDRKLKIIVNPDDLELLKDGLTQDDDVTWQWVQDASVTRGGCRLETADTRIDATVELRIKTVIDRLLGDESDVTT
jgi:flagellar assembly protein FliH